MISCFNKPQHSHHQNGLIKVDVHDLCLIKLKSILCLKIAKHLCVINNMAYYNI